MRARTLASRWLVMLAVGLTLLALILPASDLSAQERTGSPWETLSPPGPIYRLFAPAGDVLYALAASGLYRSDDAGEHVGARPGARRDPDGWRRLPRKLGAFERAGGRRMAAVRTVPGRR